MQTRTRFVTAFGVESDHVSREMMQVYFLAQQKMMHHVLLTFALVAHPLYILSGHQFEALSSPCVFSRVLYLIF